MLSILIKYTYREVKADMAQWQGFREAGDGVGGVGGGLRKGKG